MFRVWSKDTSTVYSVELITRMEWRLHSYFGFPGLRFPEGPWTQSIIECYVSFTCLIIVYLDLRGCLGYEWGVCGLCLGKFQ